MNDLYGTLIIDSHKELTAAWKAVGESQSEEARATLVKMPLTEAEATELTATWGSADNALVRKATISEWRGFARDKYAAARKAR